MRLYRYGEPMHKQETENNSDFHTMRMGSFQYGFDSLAPLLVWLGIACVMVASGPSMGANFTKLTAPCFVLYRTGAMCRTCDKGMPYVLSPYLRKWLSTRCCPCSSRHCSSVLIWKAWPRCALPYNVWVPDIARKTSQGPLLTFRISRTLEPSRMRASHCSCNTRMLSPTRGQSLTSSAVFPSAFQSRTSSGAGCRGRVGAWGWGPVEVGGWGPWVGQGLIDLITFSFFGPV